MYLCIHVSMYLVLCIYVFMYLCMVITFSRLMTGNRPVRLPINPAININRDELNREKYVSLSPFAPERDRFGRPVRCQPARSPHPG